MKGHTVMKKIVLCLGLSIMFIRGMDTSARTVVVKNKSRHQEQYPECQTTQAIPFNTIHTFLTTHQEQTNTTKVLVGTIGNQNDHLAEYKEKIEALQKSRSRWRWYSCWMTLIAGSLTTYEITVRHPGLLQQLVQQLCSKKN